MKTLEKNEKNMANWKTHTYKITNFSSADCFRVKHFVLY